LKDKLYVNVKYIFVPFSPRFQVPGYTWPLHLGILVTVYLCVPCIVETNKKKE